MSLQTDRPPHLSETPSSDTESDERAPLSDDDIFHILQTNRRRDAIRYLLGKDDAVKMRDVAEYVAARENETTVAKLSSTERQRVYIPLYQSHLPKLDKEGIIEYNKSRGIVRPTDRLELFRPYLQMRADDSETNSDLAAKSELLRRRNPVLTVASAGLLLASAIGTFAAVSAVETSLTLAVAIGAIAIPGLVLGMAITALLAVAIATNDAPLPLLSDADDSTDGPR